MLDGKSDLAYFKQLFEAPDKKKKGPESWDERAARWGRELETDGAFRRSMDDRIEKTARYLRQKGLLKPGDAVADIGCGPGRYAAAFAETAGFVLGLDFSAGMVELGRAYARERGLENVSFAQCDFHQVDIEKQGWVGQFDLVFTSITPAIGTVADLEKAMKMSRGYCFNSSYIYWQDELEAQLAQEVFQRAPRPLSHWRWHYALTNLLFLMGYFPETTCYRQKTQEPGKVSEDMARYYASRFTPDKDELEENTRRVYRYLEQMAGPEGTILQRYERWYAWVLWDVRCKAPERA